MEKQQTKWCSAGKHEVDVSNFWKRGKGLQPNCRDCQRKTNEAWYDANKEQHIKNILDKRYEYEDILKQWKSTLRCVKCGENHTTCLDFHHIDPAKKEFTVSGSAHQYGWQTILNEICKCVVLCKNCHTKVHDGVLEVTDAELCSVQELKEISGV